MFVSSCRLIYRIKLELVNEVLSSSYPRQVVKSEKYKAVFSFSSADHRRAMSIVLFRCDTCQQAGHVSASRTPCVIL